MGNCWATRVRSDSPTHDNSPRQISQNSSTSKGDASKNSGSVIKISTGSASSNESPGLKDSINSGNLRAFSFNDLKAATQNFRSENLLGEGGFGCVFKGWIDEKKLQGSTPGDRISDSCEEAQP